MSGRVGPAGKVVVLVVGTRTFAVVALLSRPPPLPSSSTVVSRATEAYRGVVADDVGRSVSSVALPSTVVVGRTALVLVPRVCSSAVDVVTSGSWARVVRVVVRCRPPRVVVLPALGRAVVTPLGRVVVVSLRRVEVLPRPPPSSVVVLPFLLEVVRLPESVVEGLTQPHKRVTVEAARFVLPSI